MKKIFLIFFINFCFAFPSNYKYFITLKSNEENLISGIGIGCFKFITGKEIINDIRVIDENNFECEVIGINYLKDEIEVFFKLSNSLSYNAFLGYTPGKGYKKFKKGKILLDDYLPPNSVKSGIWLWDKKSFSGIYSHTNGENYLFHRVSLSKTFPINPDDKIITYVYIEENSPVEEIMVEVISRYRRHYYFSFGEDKIDIKGIKKEKLGNLPQKGKWIKIEIPLLKIREKNIEGLGFYNDKGKVYWDRVSLNEVPVEMEIKRVINLENNDIPYFNYSLEGPFKIKDRKISFLKLDASPSQSKKLIWEIDGKIYEGEKVDIVIENKKEIDVKLKNEKGGIFYHKIDLENDELKEVSLNFDVLPFENFAYENENLYIPFKIENMSEIPLTFEIFYKNNKENIFLLPGKENGKIMNLNLSLEKSSLIGVSLFGIEVDRKEFEVVDLNEIDYSIDGVFLKKGGKYLIFKIPEYKNGNKKRFSKILVIGGFPSELMDLFKKNNLEAEFLPEENLKFVNYLLCEFNFIQRNLFKINEEYVVIFFPFLNSLLRRHRVSEWGRVYDSIFYLLTKKTPNLIVISPFPSFPEVDTFEIYRDKLKEICERRKINFIDLYEIFLKIENGSDFFKINEYVYRNFPNREGLEIVFEVILKFIEK